jgi:hypothetical protein
MLIVRGCLSDMNHYSMQMLKFLFFIAYIISFYYILDFFMCILHTGHWICCGRQEARGVVPVFHAVLLYEIESTACPAGSISMGAAGRPAGSEVPSGLVHPRSCEVVGQHHVGVLRATARMGG